MGWFHQRVAKNLDGVKLWDCAALVLCEPVEVHQAGHVRADEHVGLDFEHVIEFERSHLTGNVREGDGEGSAETAALFRLPEGDHLGIFDRCKQRAHGFAGLGAAAVTGSVKRNSRRFFKFSGPCADVEVVENEIDYFSGSLGKRVDRGIRFLFELEFVAVAVHRGARAGGDDHRHFACKDLGAVARDFARRLPIARVECRLAAAGLVVGKIDRDAEVLKDLDRGFCDIIEKGVAKAGAHEKYALIEGAGAGGGHEKVRC